MKMFYLFMPTQQLYAMKKRGWTLDIEEAGQFTEEYSSKQLFHPILIRFPVS